ncbi:hypothetical protein [Pseudonocardia sp. T1-2H]|uniref:hypothetical protein n=1 Tax=Pseudonocardia sp. T1-2H TaxID=3128899 RepID=UPI004053800C
MPNRAVRRSTIGTQGVTPRFRAPDTMNHIPTPNRNSKIGTNRVCTVRSRTVRATPRSAPGRSEPSPVMSGMLTKTMPVIATPRSASRKRSRVAVDGGR